MSSHPDIIPTLTVAGARTALRDTLTLFARTHMIDPQAVSEDLLHALVSALRTAARRQDAAARDAAPPARPRRSMLPTIIRNPADGSVTRFG